MDEKPVARVRDDTAKAERAWLEEEARHREARFERKKLGADTERRGERAEMTVLELHRHAAERAAKLSTVAAGSVEQSRGGGERAGPPRPQSLDDDPRWREQWRVIRGRFERVHDLLDEAEGHGTTAATAQMLGMEKDRKVLEEGEGLTAVGVVELLGSDIAGSPETVRRIRRKSGRSIKDGSPARLPTDTTGGLVSVADAGTVVGHPVELDDEQWLRREYTSKGDVAVAAELGVSRTTVRRARQRLGIPSRARGRPRGGTAAAPPRDMSGTTPAAARISARMMVESQAGGPTGARHLVAARIRAVHESDLENDQAALEDALTGAASALGLWLDRLLAVRESRANEATGGRGGVRGAVDVAGVP